MSDDGKLMFRELFGKYELVGVEAGNACLVTLKRSGETVWTETIPKSMRFSGARDIVKFVDDLVEKRLRESDGSNRS